MYIVIVMHPRINLNFGNNTNLERTRNDKVA